LELATPVDNGLLLPGTMRNTILDLKDRIMQDHGISVTERPISIHEVMNAHSEGRLIEVIGTSTPSFVQPIKRIVYKGKHVELPTDENSKYVKYLNLMIQDIMTGPSDHQWVTRMCED
jgi:branched-chain amino acid aminotransferase